MNKFIFVSCLLFVFFFFKPNQISAAKVFQVSNASLLQIGDDNRVYPVRIACIEVHSNKEVATVEWLKKELPRNQKVNLKPLSFEDGIMVAKVISIGSMRDIGEEMMSQGFALNTCGIDEVN